MRCPACGAVALTDDARFCVACGGPFGDALRDRFDAQVEAPAPPPPPATVAGAVDPASEPRASPPRQRRSRSPRVVAPPSADVAPSAPATVPIAVVIAGVVVLLVVLLVMLVST